MNERSLFDDTRAAARPTESQAAGDRQRVLDLLIGRGAEGATDQEAAEVLGIPQDTARARRVELRDKGLVADSGRRRPSSTGHGMRVWMIATAAAIGAAGERVSNGASRASSSQAAMAPGPGAERSTRPGHFSGNTAGRSGEGCPKCRCLRTVDVPIHEGQSVRRDCAMCGAFSGFVRWHGEPVPPESNAAPRFWPAASWSA